MDPGCGGVRRTRFSGTGMYKEEMVMKVQMLTVSLLLLGLTMPVRAQSQSDQMREVREQMRVLQEKLKALDVPENFTATGQRTTQLGGRVRVREEPPAEEIVVVRVYDLSDLLALVSPYPAMVATDLAPCDTPLFPCGASVSSGVGIASGMGGMGGMGMGSGITSVYPQGNPVGSPSSPQTPQHVLKQVGPQIMPQALAESTVDASTWNNWSMRSNRPSSRRNGKIMAARPASPH